MTYYTDNKTRKYVQGYGFLSFAKKFGSKYGKKFVNKGISAGKRFNKSKYGQALKKEGLKLVKSSGKQILDKVVPAAIDLAGSKIADKIISLGNKQQEEPQEEIQEEQEITIAPERIKQIIDDLRLF